jgi:L-aminopeptidase/D-esterase-like protein
VSAEPDAPPGARASFARFGVAVGHATDEAGATGCTVVRGIRGPLRGAVAILGRATGTRELALLELGHLVDRVDAILLTGGSAYGLDATAGVMRWCEAQGRGFPVGAGVVPIVPAAVIFDLLPLGRFDARPTPAMAWSACDDARADDVAEGSVGAGTGATCAKVLGPERAAKGGVGCAVVERDGLAAGAVMVVNAFGVVHDAAGRPLVAGSGDATREAPSSFADAAGRNTTIGAVVVSAPLSKLALAQLARAATAAFHRRIVPAGSPFDGDVLFALAPMEWEGGAPRATEAKGSVAEGSHILGGVPLAHGHSTATEADVEALGAGSARKHDDAGAPESRHPFLAQRTIPPLGLEPDAATTLALESLAVQAIEAAIERAVRLARGRDGVPGLADDTPRTTTA